MTDFNPPFSNQKDLFIWGPIPVRNYYCCPMVLVMSEGRLKQTYGKNYFWPLTVLLFRDGKATWINDFDELRTQGGKMFLDKILVKSERKKIRKRYDYIVREIKNSQTTILPARISRLSDAKFLSVWNAFHQRLVRFLVHGFVPEEANYGGEKLLENQIQTEVKNPTDVAKLMQILTAPVELSFYQKEEIALSKTNDIGAHAKKFAWIRNSYYGTQAPGEAYFRERKQKLPPNLAAVFKQHLNEAQEKKRTVQKRFELSERTMQMAEALSYSIAWQDHRKGIMFQYISTMEVLLNEMLSRKHWNKNEALTLTSSELGDFFSKKADYSAEMKRRLPGFTFILQDYQKVLNEKETQKLWKYYLEDRLAGEKISNEVTGTVASTGKSAIVRGRVRILLDPHDHNSIQTNEVLVCPMTSPEYVFAMKKAIAIVTDTGGLTSHAAIVSRELQKPCIVGTRLATRAFQNGDRVEVNTQTGLVQKITGKKEITTQGAGR